MEQKLKQQKTMHNNTLTMSQNSNNGRGCKQQEMPQSTKSPMLDIYSQMERAMKRQKTTHINGGCQNSKDPDAAVPDSSNDTASTEEDDDDYLLPPKIQPSKHGGTPYGTLRSCCCQNSVVCRGIALRWIRLRESRHIFYQLLPGSSTTIKNTPAGQYKAAYRMAVLRSLGYKTDGSKLSRKIFAGTKQQKVQETTMDKVFSERLSILHYHPEVRPYITDPTERAKGRGNILNKWQIPFDLGQKLGLKHEDKCPTFEENSEQAYFALPNFSSEEALAEVEKAENEYKQKSMVFLKQQKTLSAEMAAKPSKFVMKIHTLQEENANLQKQIEELKANARRDLSQKKALQAKNERLEEGLEKLARRMDLTETSQNMGGTFNSDAKDIYKWATGKHLSEDGVFGVEPAAKGSKSRRWADPRMDRAAQAKWDNPSISSEEALRIGGYEFPPLEGLLEKAPLDSDGVTVSKRKLDLQHNLKRRKERLAKKAANHPEAAREYERRYPPVEPTPGVFAGLDLSNIPDQPLVHSSRCSTGFRGVKKTNSGKFDVCIGTGRNGQSKQLGTFETLEEAASIYAKAKFYVNQHGIPQDWTSPGDSDDDERIQDILMT